MGAAVQAAIEHYRRLGCEIREISLPHTKYAVGAYYIIATAECSSNLARYDGVRYGHRSAAAADAVDIYFKSRAEGFGEEVKRRDHPWHLCAEQRLPRCLLPRAQKVRTLIRRDFLEAYKEVDAILTPTTPTPAFRKGEKSADPLAMYLNDIYTIGVNLSGLPGISVPCGFTRGGPADWSPDHRPALQGGGAPGDRPRLRSGTTAGTSRHPEAMNYEAVIGLEVHVQVKTVSKMFSRFAAGYGMPPNTLTDPVVLALPGALPVMNRAALDQVDQDRAHARVRDRAGVPLGPEELLLSRIRRRTTRFPSTTSPICRGG